MSGVCLKLSVGRAGGGGSHGLYITRERATRGEHERVWTGNVPQYVDPPDHELTYKERAANIAEYFRQRDEDELRRSDKGRERDTEKDVERVDKTEGPGRGRKDRTHYRLIYSFDREVTDDKIKEMVTEHLRENFPKARYVASIHRDTDNPHAHVQLAARQTDGRKIQLDRATYRTLDERWARIYGREFGRHLEEDHLEKKAKWREWMKESYEAKERGEDIPPRPRRETHKRDQIKEKKEMAARQLGVRHGDERRITGDQRSAPDRSGQGARTVAPGASGDERRGEREAARRDHQAEQPLRGERERTPARRADAPGPHRSADRVGEDLRREGADLARAAQRGGPEDGRGASPVRGGDTGAAGRDDGLAQGIDTNRDGQREPEPPAREPVHGVNPRGEYGTYPGVAEQDSAGRDRTLTQPIERSGPEIPELFRGAPALPHAASIPAQVIGAPGMDIHSPDPDSIRSLDLQRSKLDMAVEEALKPLEEHPERGNLNQEPTTRDLSAPPTPVREAEVPERGEEIVQEFILTL